MSTKTANPARKTDNSGLPTGNQPPATAPVESSDAAAMRAGLGDAGGEEAEIVGTGAVGEVGDARAQDGDRFGR